ncbi:hypothetical protein LCGC14_1232310 [marine sediment metagenome]|uniref:Uncharacterized protein n=1 Tax=marine sediment metagenome TaxID=412755 RepID=A0A0F9LC82_9ZZZZ
MGKEAGATWLQNQIALGKYDFSAQKSVSNAVAPGVLIRTTTPGMRANVTDIIIYNAAGAAAVITFYDEDGKVYLKLKVGSDETAIPALKSSIPYGDKNIYARTDQAVNAEITVAGKEVLEGW